MENDERIELYNELVEKYSKAYYKKVHDIFELEDLAQEVWQVLLQVEEADRYAGTNDASEKTYLISAIRHRIHRMIAEEIRLRQVIQLDNRKVDIYVSEEETSPEELVEVKEKLNRVRLNVRKIKHGEFIFDHMHLTLRELSRIAASQGIQLPKSTIFYKKKAIKDIMLKENVKI